MAVKLPFLFRGRCISSGEIKAVISIHAVLVQATVFLCQYPIDKIKSFRKRDRVSCSIHEYGAEFPFPVTLIIHHYRHIMAAIVSCWKFLAFIQPGETSPGP